MSELRIFSSNKQRKDFMLLPVFLRLTPGEASELADLYRSDKYKALLADENQQEPERDWAALASSVTHHTGVRPEQVGQICT